ncbi:MAG TPA: hypothetical protein PLN38_13930 [Chitinophagales bacterium]|nr:hypothetical protein [Chitinophagales bacterium]
MIKEPYIIKHEPSELEKKAFEITKALKGMTLLDAIKVLDITKNHLHAVSVL